MGDEVRYFNFPVQLLDGFLVDYKKSLNNISDYAIYTHSLKLSSGTATDKIEAAAKYFGLTLNSNAKTIANGKALNFSIDANSPMVGINLTIFWDYYKNDKSEFDLVCLLAFLALKSIVQKKPYCKLDNKFWLARMDGQPKSCEICELSEAVTKYANEYQTKKIKTALREWGLVTYSRYTRGFYVSFTMELGDLVYEAEKKRKSTKEKQYKKKESEALARALKRLNETRP